MKRLVLLAVCPLVLLCLTVQAQAMRDPTLAPAIPGTSDGVGKAAPSLPEGPLSVVIVDGKPHLMGGTRLYSQGQMLGSARIERITETEVWLREAGQLRKVQQFPGVVRLNSKEKASP
jgi:hypothetical protein